MNMKNKEEECKGIKTKNRVGDWKLSSKIFDRITI